MKFCCEGYAFDLLFFQGHGRDDRLKLNNNFSTYHSISGELQLISWGPSSKTILDVKWCFSSVDNIAYGVWWGLYLLLKFFM